MKKRYDIELMLYILLNLSGICLINDYLTYFINLNYYLGMGISFLIVVLINYLLRNNFKVSLKFTKKDLIFFFILFIIMAITIVFPDRMYDTLNYHLYSQEHPFNSILNGDLFPSKVINSFTYSLTDRMFYPFRLLFGYRMGLILNYLLLISIYYQVKRIFSKFIKNEWIIIIGSLLCVLNLSIIDLIDVYYADLFSLVYLLEIVNIALFDCLDKNNILKFSYIGFISGLAFCTKISNAFFIFIFGLLYLIRNKSNLKNVKWYVYIVFIIMFVIPSFVYAYYAYKETGNPVFPFYNTIFKSGYYPDSNWMDLRFGPNNVIEVIFWPIIMNFKMNKAIDIGIVEPLWVIGYISALIYVIIFVMQKIKHQVIEKNRLCLVLVTLLCYLIWAKFILGYTRYGLVLLILSGIVFTLLLYDSFKNKYYIIVIVLLASLGYHFYYSGITYLTKSCYWSYNNILAYGKTSYIYNLNRVFNDYKEDNINLGDNGVWGVEMANSGYMMLLNDDIKKVSLIDFDATEKEVEVNTADTNYKNIYTLFDAIEVKDFIGNLNSSGYILDEYRGTYIPNFLNSNNYMYVFKIVKGNELNTVDTCNEYETEINSYKSIKISGWVGLSNISKKYFNHNYKIQVIGERNKDELVLSSYNLNDNLGNLNSIDINTNIKNINKIKIVMTDDENNEVNDLWFMLLNYKVEV